MLPLRATERKRFAIPSEPIVFDRMAGDGEAARRLYDMMWAENPVIMAMSFGR